MSKNSQLKRSARAKQRARQRAQQRPRSEPSADWWTLFDAPPAETARERASSLLASIGSLPAAVIIEKLITITPADVRAAAEQYLLSCLRRLYAAGWRPAELVRHSRLKIDAAASDLTRWLVAAERHGPGLDGVDPRWRLQFEEADPPRLTSADHWLDAWSRSRGAPAADAETIVRLLDVLVQLPMLELLAPPPPGITAIRPLVGSEPADTSPILTRVRALLAKAESSEHEAEAATFTAKAHELMTKHAIDEATIEGARHRDPGRPSVLRLPVDPPYPDGKALLLQTVATETRCRTLFHASLQLSTVIGYPADLEATELLFTSLLVQAQRSIGQATAGAPAGSRHRSTAFRSAFLQGFAGRIGERLAEVNRLTYADGDAATFLPVLRSREERIAAFLDDELGAGMVATRVRGGYDPMGYQRGILAGDAAELTAGVVGG